MTRIKRIKKQTDPFCEKSESVQNNGYKRIDDRNTSKRSKNNSILSECFCLHDLYLD